MGIHVADLRQLSSAMHGLRMNQAIGAVSEDEFADLEFALGGAATLHRYSEESWRGRLERRVTKIGRHTARQDFNSVVDHATD
jgi:hypothetical protein